MSEPAATKPRKSRMSGRHVLMCFLGFFGVIFAVDGFMIYQAVSTFGGVETPDAYRKGLEYNTSIAQDERQTALGWRDDTKFTGTPERLQVMLRDKDDAAVPGKRVLATIGRPATNRQDVTVTLAETAPGLYEAVFPGAVEGTWIVDLSAYDGGSSNEPVYQARRRAWIKP